MTQKRFTLHIDWFNYDKTEGEATLKDYGQPLLDSECVEDMRTVKTLLNMLHEENRELRLSNLSMQTRLTEVAKITKEWIE